MISDIIVLYAPINVSIRNIHGTGAIIHWQLVDQPSVSGVEITVNQLDGLRPGEGLKNFIIQVRQMRDNTRRRVSKMSSYK